jgi:hypothetical protein
MLIPFRIDSRFSSSQHVVLIVPASALMFDKAGLRVATVGPGNKVMVKTVTIMRDLGKIIELDSGLSPDDHVIESPPDGIGIADGDSVRIANTPESRTDPSVRPVVARASTEV